MLLIDDVQFLASKAKTEEEFFHTFNALYETGRQLVLTCDRLPSQLAAVEERLRERFESGLVAVIKPPDHATRVAILRKRAALDHIAVDRRRRARGDRRSHHRQRTRARGGPDQDRRVPLAYAAPDRRQARRGGPRRDPSAAEARTAPTSVGDIQHAVASYYGLALAQLTSSSRAASVDLAAPGRDPPNPCPDRRVASCDRRRVRRPQSRDGPPCLQARVRAHGPRSTSCSRGRGADDASSTAAVPTDPLDRLVCFFAHPRISRSLQAIRRFVNTDRSPMTSKSHLRYSS